MPKIIKPLSDTEIKAAKSKDKDYTLTDGGGLYIIIKTNGKKTWRLQYTFNAKRHLVSFGDYPIISLAEARQKRTEYKKQIENGSNPTQEKKEAKKQIKENERAEQNTFENVLQKYLEVISHKIEPDTLQRKKRVFELYFLPFLQNKQIKEITKHDYIELILRVRDKGIIYSANRIKGEIQQLLNYLEEAQIIDSAPTLKMKNVLPQAKQKNYAHITDEKQLGELLRAIDDYQGGISTKYALKLLPYLFVRPQNIRGMEWSEINFEKKIWTIPALKMKMREPHIVPLSHQAIEILKEAKKVNGTYKLVFVSDVSTIKPLSENTLNMALMRLGYKDKMTSHGFRHTASTILHENMNKHGFNSEVIEKQMAHEERDRTKAAYNKAQYIEQRTKLMQYWADYLDNVKNK